MSMKFTSCSFAQYYRRVSSDGSVLGGPMVYLEEAFKEKFNLVFIGKFLGIFYAVMTIMASFGGGNLFQGNQTFELLSSEFPSLQTNLSLLVLFWRYFQEWFYSEE